MSNLKQQIESFRNDKFLDIINKQINDVIDKAKVYGIVSDTGCCRIVKELSDSDMLIVDKCAQIYKQYTDRHYPELKVEKRLVFKTWTVWDGYINVEQFKNRINAPIQSTP